MHPDEPTEQNDNRGGPAAIARIACDLAGLAATCVPNRMPEPAKI